MTLSVVAHGKPLPCVAGGTAIAFENGVTISEAEAQENMYRLRDTLQLKWPSDKREQLNNLSFGVLYNRTDGLPFDGWRLLMHASYDCFHDTLCSRGNSDFLIIRSNGRPYF